MKYLFPFLILIFILNSCTQKKESMKQDNKQKAIDIADLDTTINPADDFYQYATGGWQKNNPLPDEESRFGSFDQLAKSTNKKVQDLIIELSESKTTENSMEWKIQTMYNMGMDTIKIEKDSLSPILSLIDEIDNIKTKNDIVKQVAKFHSMNIASCFEIYGSADRENSNMQILYLQQGGLGLPNRDYYIQKDEHSKEIQQRYKKYIAEIFQITNIDKNKAEDIAEKIYDLEYKLADKSMTNLQLRDPFATTNRMSLDKLSQNSKNFDFSQYFKMINLKALDIINVSQPDFFASLSKLIETTNIETWKLYFKWNLLNSAAPHLYKAVADLNYDFYGKYLSGTLKQKERWRKVINDVNATLGEAVGKIFVNKYFPPEAKERMDTLVENLRKSFELRIEKLTWMSDSTKLKAIDKLKAINVKIGYPNKWKNYDNLNIKEDYYYANILRANEFEFNDMIEKIGKPVDKEEWFMNPQTVNAYYSSSMNEICFPAGILQEPFFYMFADDAVNYGAIGVVIGHEMTHGFDDKGRNFDKYGNLKTWWTKEDEQAFTKEANILVERYNNIEVLPNIYADGKLSLGENIADYGGLKIGYDALMMALKNNNPEKIDGFTPQQRFFLSYAKIWGQNIRDEEIKKRTKDDVHSLGKWRVNGQLVGIQEFHQAFNVKQGDKMYIAPDKWCNIW